MAFPTLLNNNSNLQFLTQPDILNPFLTENISINNINNNNFSLSQLPGNITSNSNNTG